MDAGEVGKFLSMWGKKKKKKKRAFFSPILELARFFGTTSAKTDQVQVGFSQKDRGVVCIYGYQFALFYCTLLYPLPYMVYTWYREISVGVSESCIIVLYMFCLTANHTRTGSAFPFINITWIS